MTTLPKTRRASARGYTVVEVIAAMTLFAIGAAGVISMQRVTIQGGDDARRFDVASNIANQWAARLQRDSMQWTLPDTTSPNTENFSTATKWLKDLAGSGMEGKWHMPTIPSSSSGADSPAYDVFGRELTSGSGDHMFCVQYRLNWVAKQPTSGPWIGMFMRAEIRVVWARLETALIANCASIPDGTDPDPTKYHFVYVTTALRPNPAQ